MSEGKNLKGYEDIIHLSRPTTSKHTPMSLYDRAAQFSPFAALTGHEAAIIETARLTDCEAELVESEQEELAKKLKWIQEHLQENPEVTITYFVPDEKKAGGQYISHTGIVKKIKEYENVVVMNDEVVIAMKHIKKIIR